MRRGLVVLALGLSALTTQASAHVGEHPSVHDTIASVIERLRDLHHTDDLSGLNVSDVLDNLTEDERYVLGTEHLTFRVNVPVIVSILRDERGGDDPFWLEERGFIRTDSRVKVERHRFDVWQREFDAGVVGLGVNSISGLGDHYFVGLKTRKRTHRNDLKITEIYPGRHTLGRLHEGERPYSDNSDHITDLPPELDGQVLLRGVDDRKRVARVIGKYRKTRFPSSAEPDHVVLTWSDDPQTTQTIQWRTNTAVERGVVAFARAVPGAPFNAQAAAKVEAQTRPIVTNTLKNDPVVHRHTVTLRGLDPGATYVYALGAGDGTWTRKAEFTTAPEETVPFTFVYMGDAQNGLDTWGKLVHKAQAERPDAKFYVMAGDLVNRGAERDDWDAFFENAKGVFDRRQVVPVPGNHEYQGGEPELYLDLFTLPESGPVGELAYTLEYSNALFVMLDSNLPPATQTDWLEAQLAGTDATWKFVVYHHPAYSSSPNRNNRRLREKWGAVFDKYHVDLALQGHDHAYLRTYPMKAGQRAASPADGTIYIVSVSGTKHYKQGDFSYTKFGMTNVSTYQVLDIRIDGNRLEYRAYDLQGELRDSFVIEK